MAKRGHYRIAPTPKNRTFLLCVDTKKPDSFPVLNNFHVFFGNHSLTVPAHGMTASRHRSEEVDDIGSRKPGQDIPISLLGLRLMRSISMIRAFSPINETACSGVVCGCFIENQNIAVTGIESFGSPGQEIPLTGFPGSLFPGNH